MSRARLASLFVIGVLVTVGFTWGARAEMLELSALRLVAPLVKGNGLSETTQQARSARKAAGPTVTTDKYDYQPGETVFMTGDGFLPGEMVALTVEHATGVNDGAGHEPFYAFADQDGQFTEQWYVNPDDSLNSLFLLTATGSTSGLVARTMFTDAFFFERDDGGADDVNSNQVDLNRMGTDEVGLPSTLAVQWHWDDTGWTGGNTGDACALFDTDVPKNGRANFAICVKVAQNPSVYQGTSLHTCNDTRSDRCAGPTLVWNTLSGPQPPPNSSTCTASRPVASDPFSPHGGGNVCSGTDCKNRDTVAACSINMAEVGAQDAFLINVCTVPSNQPNSNPFDCVITPDNGFLTIVKANADATATTRFTFNLGPGSISQTGQSSWSIDGSGSVRRISFRPGTYDLKEAVPQNWKLDSASCVVAGTTTGTGSSAVVPGPADAGVTQFSIQPGLETTCTFTNSRNPARLTLIKNVINDNGGQAQVGDFILKANDLIFPSGVPADVEAGTYSLSELTTVSGYTAGPWACSGGQQNGNAITLAPGEAATCQITNDDQAGTLIVKKVVMNEHGGTKTAKDFSFAVDGGTPVAFEADGENQVTVNAGTHTVVEPAVGGYTASYENCTNVSVGNGASATCTITNRDQAGTLIVNKVVVNNNGGTKTAGDFSFTVDGSPPVAFEADGENHLTVSAGTHSIVEPPVPGYTTTYSNCTNVVLVNGGSAICTITNDDQPGTLMVKKMVVNEHGGTKTASDFSFVVNGGAPVAFEADGENQLTVNAGPYSVVEPTVNGYTASYDNCTNVNIGNGESATCTITNRAQAATLIVKKVVVNDNGGKKTVGDFAFTMNGAAPVAFETDGENLLTLSAGTYTIVEPPVPGYTTTYSNCANVVLVNGGSATCTITNDDQPGTLIVKKVVVNEHAGTKTASDFSFVVNDSGAVAFEADGENQLRVNAGSYTVVEPAVSGYAASYDNCTNVTIGNGASATCTITNRDQAATLIVRKVVLNDNGGKKTVGDFAFTVNGAAPVAFETDGENQLTLSAGTYTIAEPPVPGYTTTYSNCANVVLVNGGSATCTITNDDERSTPGIATVMSWVLHDRAILTNLVAGAPDAATAQVTFFLYGPGDPACSGPSLNGPNGESRPVVGGQAATAVGFLATQPGTYRWIARYGGDQFNAPVSTSCGDEVHTITVEGRMP